ncbi:MAG: DUF4097 family beta strand repeat-containing protein [Tenericutes bacterium]|jgi:DUF4097 and DUF4098 domain-containing protein YvlB|nr:DUF4097 family beta strand repeat-containing protein [Mycoplasmatota bacterium]
MSKLLKVGLLLILVGIVAVVVIPLTTDNQVFSLNNDENYTLTEKSYSFDKFDSFNFDFENRDVYIYESEDNNVHLSYYLREKDILEFDDETNELTIEISRRWVDNIFIFDIGINRDYLDVYLYLPTTLIDSNLNITSSNGKITVDTDMQYQSVYIEGSNGNITLSNLQAVSINTNTSNGDITLDNIQASNSITGETSNGKVYLDQVVSDEIDFDTSNGRIEATNITALDVTLESSNGKVFLSINGNMDDYKIDLSTSLGDRIVNDFEISSGVLNSTESNSVKLETSNGDVEVQFLND